MAELTEVHVDDGSATVRTGEARAPEGRARVLGRIDGRLAAAVGLGWYVLFTLGQALEPAPRDPHAVPAWIETTISVVLLGMLAVMIVGLVTRRRVGVLAAVGAGIVYLAATIACPTTGHHAFGLWWVGEMAVVSVLLAGSAVALSRT